VDSPLLQRRRARFTGNRDGRIWDGYIHQVNFRVLLFPRGLCASGSYDDRRDDESDENIPDLQQDDDIQIHGTIEYKIIDKYESGCAVHCDKMWIDFTIPAKILWEFL